MRLWRSRTLWGVLLVVLGLLFLLESLQILALGAAWALLFAAAGLVFGYTYLEDREAWWAIIPAMTLLSIAALIGVDTLLPEVGSLWGASIFLGGLSLSFWIIYFATRSEQWWALIPGGILLSLALSLAVEPFLADDVFAGLFMFGIAVTFALVYLLPNPEGRMGWALIPAGVLTLVGVIILSVTTSYANLIWPVLLIVGGAYILARSLRR
ncbi:MAG: hypothetical protein JXC32_19405 [Anaerolineae bacterium]|nr:hypothetical protein [Anaerolineae bacterium]